jgi:beta-galactosidase
MKKYIFLAATILLFSNAFAQDLFSSVGDQLIRKDNLFNGRFPIYTENGKWIFDDKPNWFSGFTSGELWHMYDMTGNPEFKRRALVHADTLLKYASLDNTHDLGFIFYNSCVRAYQHTGITKYKDAAIQAARTLIKRYNKNGKFIRAWGKMGSADREGLMIIDTMMNLELLFWASLETGDDTFYDIAYRHAITCMNEHIRKDFSSYHVVEFDPNSGAVVKKHTHQGYADESTWARGEAWGIYGFALAYRYTGDDRFLVISQQMAEYFQKKLPSDLVPYWDLDLKGDSVIRDASASAIAASGLFLLSELATDKETYEKYRSAAVNITDSLSGKYVFTNSLRPKEEGILLHTVYNFAKKFGIDESYPAGDFYFIECLKKRNDLVLKEKIIADAPGRKRYSINDTWFYLEDDIASLKNLYQSAQQWQKVNLPHTWNAADALDQEPGYRKAASWYEKELFIPEMKNPTVMQLHFEGVNMKAEVYVNGQRAGGHIGGYVGFDVDISPFVKRGEINRIHVKADNSYDPYVIPSQKSDFILYGGISRNVWLDILPATHIQRIQVQTPGVSKQKASTKVQLSVRSHTARTVAVEGVIKDPAGKIVSSYKKSINVKEGSEAFNLEFSDITKPVLWSPSTPNLYTVELKLKEGSTLIDALSDRIGYRWFEFKQHGAFFLNGERLLLRGTHRHEELSGYGNALPDSLHRNDIRMIKEMGANFVRLAHYPQAPEVYRACDEIGLLVWDENPWCRGGMGPDEWKTNTKNIFMEMILQNYNHPSIILWSIGNESDWLPDFPGGDQQDSLAAFANVLHSLAKELDPYRSTTTRKFPAAKDIVDVFSPSIWSGWYSDVYTNYEKSLLKARDTYKSFFHAEFGGDSHVGRHVEKPIDGEGKIPETGGDEPINKLRSGSISNIGDWSESYIVDLFDWYLHVTENLDWFTGSAQWIFRDFTTPLRPENPIPYVNQKGLVDMNNNPKDAYYVFKSYWVTDPKFCYIESHTWTDRFGAKDEAKEINVFSNCSEVELLVNGKSLGRKTRDTKQYPASGYHWSTALNEGDNAIRAVGFEKGKNAAVDTMTVLYTTRKPGKPDDIVLTQKKMPRGEYLITAKAVDKTGKYYPYLNTRVYFSALSGGTLLTTRGTPVGSSVIEMANGKAEIIFRHTPLQKAVIEVRSQEFKGTYLNIHD